MGQKKIKKMFATIKFVHIFGGPNHVPTIILPVYKKIKGCSQTAEGQSAMNKIRNTYYMLGLDLLTFSFLKRMTIKMCVDVDEFYWAEKTTSELKKLCGVDDKEDIERKDLICFLVMSASK